MDIKKQGDALDYERIAKRIIKILHESGATYRETETILEYVRGYLWGQGVQDCD